jgi:hypothetical protein|tara:strand:+ start:481 stop:690 length:210 start_codon:yes stop_codon:yes gene_type:complete
VKIGSLVKQRPSVNQLPNEDYDSRIGIVLELGTPKDEYDAGPTVWVQWQNQPDWAVESIKYLEVISESR